MKIAFLQNWFDRTSPDVVKNNNSRMLHYITESLKKNGAEVILIPPAIKCDLPNKLRHAFYKFVLHQRHLQYTDISLLKREAKIRSKIINKLDIDAVFAFSNYSLAFLETNKILAYWSDICFAQQRTGNPLYLNLTKSTLKNANFVEQMALNKIDAAFFTSAWTKNAVKNNFDVDENKLLVAPLGPDTPISHTFQDVKEMVTKKINNPICKFIFIGSHWVNKGADVAVEIVKQLNNRGLKSELMIIGCEVEGKNIPEFIKNIKFLNKNNPEELNLFIQHLSEANFFILPTLFDCTPHTICEASAFGVPSISHKFGGIPEMIKEGKNGKTFSIGENIDNYCDYVIEIYSDKFKYEQLCLSSYNEYINYLNWDFGTKIIMDKLNEIKKIKQQKMQCKISI
ncbi:MAG: glycosyltransferase family 4 protein [Ignavibacteria bacterium]|jgi:glycosyltransferase involved in cell wall biosynthesis|nr:glycosyltransferase family 4 protein [Ignavibacteria bacterium]